MANLIRGAVKVQEDAVYVSSDGRKWGTIKQANIQQRHLNKQSAIQSLMRKHNVAMPSNKYTVSISALVFAVRNNPAFLSKLAALA